MAIDLPVPNDQTCLIDDRDVVTSAVLRVYLLKEPLDDSHYECTEFQRVLQENSFACAGQKTRGVGHIDDGSGDPHLGINTVYTSADVLLWYKKSDTFSLGTLRNLDPLRKAIMEDAVPTIVLHGHELKAVAFFAQPFSQPFAQPYDQAQFGEIVHLLATHYEPPVLASHGLSAVYKRKPQPGADSLLDCRPEIVGPIADRIGEYYECIPPENRGVDCAAAGGGGAASTAAST